MNRSIERSAAFRWEGATPGVESQIDGCGRADLGSQPPGAVLDTTHWQIVEDLLEPRLVWKRPVDGALAFVAKVGVAGLSAADSAG
jgi:hypothetical protein